MALLAQLQTAPGAGNGWWWSTLTSGPALWLLGFAVLCVVVLFWLGVRLHKVSAQASPSRKVSIKERLSDDSGVAMIEFVLVTPILLFVTLLLIQTMLVFTGLFYVQYSAYAGARTAIVVVPMDLGGLPSNDLDVTGEKAGAIGASSVIALMPVSGRETSTDNTSFDVGPMLEQGFADMYSVQGKSQPNWVNEMLAQRFYYAANHTELEVHRVYPGEGPQTVEFEGLQGYTTFGPKDAISVTVHHEFALTVPLASRVFAAVGESGSYTPAGRDTDTPGPPGQWTKISSRAILTNEGIDRRLPEAPTVPRR